MISASGCQCCLTHQSVLPVSACVSSECLHTAALQLVSLCGTHRSEAPSIKTCSAIALHSIQQAQQSQECQIHQVCLTLQMPMQGFHVVLSDMCHSTMGSSSADVLRSLDLASCAAELAVGSLEATSMQQLPKVYNPMPEASQDSPHEAQQQPDQQPEGPKDRANMDGSQGVLLPKGHLVMKLLQV